MQNMMTLHPTPPHPQYDDHGRFTYGPYIWGGVYAYGGGVELIIAILYYGDDYWIDYRDIILGYTTVNIIGLILLCQQMLSSSGI